MPSVSLRYSGWQTRRPPEKPDGLLSLANRMFPVGEKPELPRSPLANPKLEQLA